MTDLGRRKEFQREPFHEQMVSVFSGIGEGKKWDLWYEATKEQLVPEAKRLRALGLKVRLRRYGNKHRLYVNRASYDAYLRKKKGR